MSTEGYGLWQSRLYTQPQEAHWQASTVCFWNSDIGYIIFQSSTWLGTSTSTTTMTRDGGAVPSDRSSPISCLFSRHPSRLQVWLFVTCAWVWLFVTQYDILLLDLDGWPTHVDFLLIQQHARPYCYLPKDRYFLERLYPWTPARNIGNEKGLLRTVYV